MITIPGVSPVMMWAGFLTLVGIMLAIDLGVFNRKAHAITIKEALTWAGVWFGLAMLFNIWIYFQFGQQSALEFFTGYLIEKSLSVDNLFVFLVIFTAFSIPREFQHRVLFWGILGAIITRGIFIGLGTAIIQHFEWAFAVFGIVLLYAAYRMQFGEEKKFDPEKSFIVRLVEKIMPVSREQHEEHFFTRVNGKRAITVLLLTLVVIELTDIVFAFDSIPAIFAITTDPFIVFTSNIFAILGLRSLYFVLADMQGMFEYLKSGLALILLFISFKLIVKPFHLEVPIFISLIFIVSVLIISIFLSVLHHRRSGHAHAAAATPAAPAAMPTEPAPIIVELPQHPDPLPPDHALVATKSARPPAVVTKIARRVPKPLRKGKASKTAKKKKR
jgi:tellurite resistance protein TerC